MFLYIVQINSKSVQIKVLILARSGDGRSLSSFDGSDWLRLVEAGMVTSSDWLGNLRSVAASLKILLSHRLLDPVHLVLVPLPVSHRSLLGLLQSSLKCLVAKLFHENQNYL